MAEYIDKEAFNKSVEERYCKPCKAEGKDHNGCLCRACWVDDMLDEVECFQTDDVAPVAHGRWLGWGKGGTPTYENYGTCSVCGEDAEIYTGHRNYCPNCGAQMHEDDFCSYGECREGKDG